MKKYLVFIIILLFPFVAFLQTDNLHSLDSDNDGLNDWEEINLYYTDPNNPDTDFDGINDKVELDTYYSPHRGHGYLLEQLDWDKDGLNDLLELRFGSDLKNSDSDGDGYDDGLEIANDYSPVNPDPVKMRKSVKVDLNRQRLGRYLNDILLDEMIISGGVGNTTPVGQFFINNKHPRAWSNLAGLWMPNWMAFKGSMYGLHALPIWPDGSKEGLDVLGQPASHGCIRLGDQDAENLYNWINIGVPVLINK